jgi:hypothetical protein
MHRERRVIAALRSLLLSLLLVTQSCGPGWHRPAQLVPGPLSRRQQVQVWRKGTMLRWHAVRVEQDTISGIPWLQPVGCDSCRRSLPRAAVDSVRVGNPIVGFWKTVAVVLAVPAAVVIAYCWRGCSVD